jgi:hypothetical protein
MVSTMAWLEFFSAITLAATQRVALPQAPASPPSGLWMRMKTSATFCRGVSSRISWSQPMPRRRSAIQRRWGRVSETGRSRRSITTKSLPRPIFRNGSAAMIHLFVRSRLVYALPGGIPSRAPVWPGSLSDLGAGLTLLGALYITRARVD